MKYRIDLRPNCAVRLGIAGVFAVPGFGPVLPFRGFEMRVLGLGLLASMKRRHDLQIVLIPDTRITVTTLDRRGERNREFSRHWAKVKLRRPHASPYRRVLVLESHGREVENGGALTGEELGAAD